MKTQYVILFILLAACSAAVAVEVNSPAVLLQQGLYAEQTEGNLDKAMEIYDQIRQKYNDVERVSARATYQLGLCNLKKGDIKKAADLFQEVTSYYPEQTTVVKMAQQQLDKIIPPETKTSLRPVVIKTSPENFTNNVSPDVNQITITFDKTMGTNGYSWCQNDNETFPQTTGKPYFSSDTLSCTLPVKLKAGQYYRIGINTPPFLGFKSTDSQIAQEFIFIFATADINENPTDIPKDLIAEAKKINSTQAEDIQIQEVHHEIDPNGLIHFKMLTKKTNKDPEPITDFSFISSDFVNITGIYYKDGKPVKYTITQEGNRFRYSISLDKPLLPGETVEGTIEGIMDGLIKPVAAIKDVYQYYVNHSPKVGEPILRIETYLLPAGAELISTTPPNMQQTEKDGRIELRQEKLIPAGGSLITSFQYKLASANIVSADSLKLEPAPWVDGEVMELRLKHPSGKEYGTIIYSAHKNNNNWQIISHMYVSEGAVSQYTFVEADANSFAPVYGQTTNWTGNFIAEYGKGNVKLTVDAGDNKSTRDIPVSGVAFDNEQAVYLIRRMPLAENYEGSFPIFTIQGGVVVECQIKVLALEDVTVEAGTFKCYKTDLSIYAGGTKTLQHTLWVSANEHKYLVKYDVGGTTTMELAKVWQKDKNKPILFENTDPSFLANIPADWRFYKYSTGLQTSLQLISPDPKAWAVLVWQKRGSDPDSASAMTIAKADCEKLKGFFENYVPDQNSWKEFRINNLRVAQYLATYQESGNSLKKYGKPKDMVEYRTYIVDASNVYWFVFRIEKDKFEENKAVLDSIVNSFDTFVQ